MVLSLFTIIPIAVSAESADTAETGADLYDGIVETGDESFPYTDSCVYVADSIMYGIIDKRGVPTGSSEVSMALLHNYTYHNLAEAAVDDEMLMFNSLFWQNLKKTLSGEFLEIANWEEEMYILLIMDYLNYYSQSSEFESNFGKNTVKFTENIYKAVIKEKDAQYLDNIDQLIENQSLQEAVALSDKSGFIHKINGYNTLLSDIETVSTTAIDFYKNLSKALAVQQADEDRIRFLKEMKKAGAGNNYFTSAVDTVISMYESSFANLALAQGSSTMLNHGLSVCFSQAKKACPQAAAIIDGMKLYNEGLNWLFNSNDVSENNLKLVIVYTMGSYAAQAVRNLRDTYTSNKTADNANAFIEGYLGYLKYQEYASNSVYGFISSTLFDGLYNKIVNIFSDSNQATYEEFKNYINNDIAFCERLEELVRKHYDLYFTFTGYQPNVLIVEVLDEPTDISDTQNQIPTDLYDNFRLSGQIAIKQDFTLSNNITIYGNLFLNGGTLDLNGYILSVGGNIYQSNGNMLVNGGTLTVSGDYRIQTSEINPKSGVTYQSSNGCILMDNDYDHVIVNGSFVTQSSKDYTTVGGLGGNRLTKGVMEIRGDFYQLKGNEYNFQSTGTHTVILNGTKLQNVHFDSTKSNINRLQIDNDDICWSGYLNVNKLLNDVSIKADCLNIYSINANSNRISIDGDVIASNTIDINYGELIINGNLQQISGSMLVNGGTLTVSGDYRIQTFEINPKSGVTYQSSNGCILMDNDYDHVIVNGSFVTQSSKDYTTVGGLGGNRLTKGVMEIRGDFYQLKGNEYNFQSTGTHTVILNGIDNVQKVTFDSNYSRFNNLKLTKDKETGYIFNPEKCWNTLYLDTDIASVSLTSDKKIAKQASSLQLNSKVNGINVPSQEVTWSVSGNTDSDTSISDKGILTVGLNENANTLTVTAVSVADPTKSASIDISVEKLQRVVFGVFVSPSTVSTIGGNNCQFSAVVYGLFSPSQEVTWSVSGNKSRNTKISADGLLTVGKDETAERLTIKATSVLDKTKSASVTVDIYQIKIVSTVSSVTVTMEPGDKKQLKVVVTGTNNPNQAVTWSVSGNNSKNTTVSATGLVSIAENETADMIVVRATSVDDTDKYGEFAINITPKATYILGDLDGDGEIMVTDATFIQRHLVNIPIPFEFNEKAVDADGDGNVTLMDATYIQRWLANLKANDNIGKIID